MSHPGYPLENPPPSMRTALLVGCVPLGTRPATSDIRAKFLSFLSRQPISGFLAAATAVPDGFTWTAWGDQPRRVFGAVLNGSDQQAAPIAWARLLLPEDGASTMNESRCAELVLHVYPRTPGGDPAPAANLAAWYDRLTGAIALPGALAQSLTDDLGLVTAAEPPAQIGVSLDTPSSMTDLVDPEDITMLAGTSAPTWFLGWAVADPDGQAASGLALTWLTQMCDSTLHLNGYEPVLEAITNLGQAPGRTVPETGQVLTVQDASPAATEVAVQRLKEALPDPARRVELSDLVNREIQQLAAQISDTTRHPLIDVPFADQLASYEEESATSACLLANGAFYGDEAQVPLWIRSLRRLMSARRPIAETHNPQTEAMRHYPALLCLWVMGLSAILADRETLLASLFLNPPGRLSSANRRHNPRSTASTPTGSSLPPTPLPAAGVGYIRRAITYELLAGMLSARSNPTMTPTGKRATGWNTSPHS